MDSTLALIGAIGVVNAVNSIRGINVINGINTNECNAAVKQCTLYDTISMAWVLSCMPSEPRAKSVLSGPRLFYIH